MSIFIDLVEVGTESKAEELLREIREPGARTYAVSPSRFSALQGAPFLYRVPQVLLDAAGTGQTLSKKWGRARQGFGASTKFHRLCWEVKPEKIGLRAKWARMAHGSSPMPFFKSMPHVVLWQQGGREAKADVITRYPYLGANYGFKIQSEEHYGEPGLCYGKRTSRFTVQVLPSEFAWSHEGTAIDINQDNVDVWGALALLNSSTVAGWLNTVCAQHKVYNYVNELPIPNTLDPSLNRLARRAFNIAEDLASLSETSTNFVLPEVLRERSQGFDRTLFESQLRAIQGEIDAVSANLYGLSAEQRAAVDRWAAGQGVGEGAKGDEDEEEEEGAEDQNEENLENGADAVRSWSVGVAFARFDIRLATGERSVPSQPDPFEPLASKSPGMLPDGGAPFMPTSGVFVDDPGHADDLAARVAAVHERVGEVPPAPDELRRTLARDFFPAHIRMYSKSRRKAPIYWQLATPSANYSVWLYIHAFSKDTLFRVQNDYVAPKLAHERRGLEGLRAEAGPSPTTAQSRAVEAQASFVEELSAMLDEVTRVAPLWDPDLDDGVILNFAPLWRLVPQNRAWQKELRAAWAALVAGDYDWAHLAMRLWPERVVSKCATDRSLAIAHDLEGVFWFEDAAGKWQARAAPTRPLEALVAERTSSAVKAALASLLEAPEPVGAARRGLAARAS